MRTIFALGFQQSPWLGQQPQQAAPAPSAADETSARAQEIANDLQTLFDGYKDLGNEGLEAYFGADFPAFQKAFQAQEAAFRRIRPFQNPQSAADVAEWGTAVAAMKTVAAKHPPPSGFPTGLAVAGVVGAGALLYALA
jgi:hypothetical protein